MIMQRLVQSLIAVLFLVGDISAKSLTSNKIGMIGRDSHDKHDEDCLFEPLRVHCELNGFALTAIIDTGAQISIMSSSCAKRCHLFNDINKRFSGRALGVGTGSGEIIGRIDSTTMRMGPLSFKSRISVLKDSNIDFLIGLDFLKRFRCEINLDENVLKLQIQNKHIRIPFYTEQPSYTSSDAHSEVLDDSDGCGLDEEADETIGDSEQEDDELLDEHGEVPQSPDRVREVYCMKKNSSWLQSSEDQDYSDDDDGYTGDNSDVSMEGV